MFPFFIDACINMMQGIKECKKNLSHSAFACIVIPSNNRQPMKSYLGLMNFGEIFDEKFHNSVPLYLIYFIISNKFEDQRTHFLKMSRIIRYTFSIGRLAILHPFVPGCSARRTWLLSFP